MTGCLDVGWFLSWIPALIIFGLVSVVVYACAVVELDRWKIRREERRRRNRRRWSGMNRDGV